MLSFLIIAAIAIAVVIGYKTGFNTGFLLLFSPTLLVLLPWVCPQVKS